MNKSLIGRISGIILLVLACPVARAAVDPSVTSFEIDGDYGSVIETSGNISDGGYQTTFSVQGSGQTWEHASLIIPYMGSNCYKAMCVSTPAGEVKDRTEQKILNSWSIDDDIRYFSLAVYVPSSTVSTNWLMFCQWWQDPTHTPPVSLSYTTDGKLALVRRCEAYPAQILYDETLAKDQWHHFVLKVKFGLADNGKLGLWKVNPATGLSENKFLDDTLTLGWQYKDDGVTLADTNDFAWKVGTYRGASELTTRIYYDNVRYAKTWSAVTKNYLTGYHKCVQALHMDGTLEDSSGSDPHNNSIDYNNDATAVGAQTSAPGYNGSGSCMYFDGVNDLVQTPVDTTDFDFGNYLTVSAWFRSNYSVSSNKTIVSMDTWSTDYKFRLNLVATNKLQFAVRHPTGSVQNVQATIGGTVLDDQWHNLVGVYNRWAADGNRLKIYLDGELIGSAAGENQPILRGNNYLYLGRYSSSYFKGYIDEVNLYNFPMTDLEVADLF